MLDSSHQKHRQLHSQYQLFPASCVCYDSLGGKILMLCKEHFICAHKGLGGEHITNFTQPALAAKSGSGGRQIWAFFGTPIINVHSRRPMSIRPTAIALHTPLSDSPVHWSGCCYSRFLHCPGSTKAAAYRSLFLGRWVGRRQGKWFQAFEADLTADLSAVTFIDLSMETTQLV